MKFNILGIILMMAAIWLGSMFGSGVASMFGFGGGIVGAVIVGLLTYVVYTLISGQKINIMSGVIFALLVYVAQLVSGLIASNTGFGGGIIGLFITAVVLSFLWGYIGKGSNSPITLGKSKGRLGRR